MTKTGGKTGVKMAFLSTNGCLSQPLRQLLLLKKIASFFNNAKYY